MKCEICDKEIKNLTGMSIHLSKKHKEINPETYYNKYIEEKAKCYFCGEYAKFKSYREGYHRICSSSICLGKTRATGTYQFLMYKYNLSKDDALELQQTRAVDRGLKIKESFDKLLENDPNYHKKRAITSPEYWKAKGLCETESIKLADKHILHFWEQSIETKKKNIEETPDIYSDINPTQLKYWLKKGFEIEDAKMKLSERQKTFSKDICIRKYGDVIGLEIFNERQHKWHNTLVKNNSLKGGYSNISQELFDRIFNSYYSESDSDDVFYATKNREIKLEASQLFLYDFVDMKQKKIIEYNGDLYHANPSIYSENDTPHPFNKTLKAKDIWLKDNLKKTLALNDGYGYLIIWDSDYTSNKDLVISECIEFLKNK